MAEIIPSLLAHPIAKKPYNAIRFSHFDPNGTPLYKLRKVDGAFGAKEALKRAFEQYGAHCFHCDEFHGPGPLGQMTRDHVMPSAVGGSDFLHNLLFTCKPCNTRKGRLSLAAFSLIKAQTYLDALHRHLERCLKSAKASNKPA